MLIDPNVPDRLWSRRDALVGLALTVLATQLACAPKNKPATTVPTTEFGFRGLRKRVRKHVPDKDRREQVLGLIKQAEKELHEISLGFGQWRSDIARLPPEEVAKVEVTTEITQKINEEMRDHLVRICELSIEARSHLNAQEWALLFPAPGAAA